jgi:hypothetical protein
MLGLIGNLFAGWKRVPKHLGQQGQVQGWFRRGMGGYIVMKELTSTAGVLRARPTFWQAALSILVIVATAVVIVAGTDKIGVPLGNNAATQTDASDGDGAETTDEGEATETPQPQE